MCTPVAPFFVQNLFLFNLFFFSNFLTSVSLTSQCLLCFPCGSGLCKQKTVEKEKAEKKEGNQMAILLADKCTGKTLMCLIQ